MTEVLLDMEYDRPGEECGVLGVWLNEGGHEAVRSTEIQLHHLAYNALVSQKNRGQQNSGLAASEDGYKFKRVVGEGNPEEAFDNGARLAALPPHPRFILGHNRYTTTGGRLGAQPMQFATDSGEMVAVGNGEFSNHQQLTQLAKTDQPSDHWVWGSIVADSIDQSHASLAGAMIESAFYSEGGYSIIGMHHGNMVMMRDPHGIRPLHYAPFSTWGWVAASEKPTLEVFGIPSQEISEVLPGELVAINQHGLSKLQYAEAEPAYCSLEDVYLSSADDEEVCARRYRSGEILAREAPVTNADVVVPILGSALAASEGYAHALGLPLDKSVIKKNKGVGRNFIDDPENRDLVKAPKHTLDLEAVRNKRVVVTDDSVVRGDTLEGIVRPIARVAKEVYIRVFSPPVVETCNLGVAIKSQEELIANRMSRQEFMARLDEDTGTVVSYEHLSLAGMQRAFNRGLCGGCFGGQYPSPNVRRFAHDIAVPLVLSEKPS